MELIILNLILLASTLYFANKVRKIDNGQKQLKEENKLLKEAQAVGKIGSWSGSLEDDIVWWSDELYRLYGLDHKTYTPLRGDFYNLVFEDDRDSYIQALTTALENGEDFKIKFRFVVPSGETRWFETEGIAFKNDKGSKAFHGTVRDITDEQNYIKKINENEFILRNAQENAKTGIWSYDLPNIMADAKQLNEVFMNLFINASQAMPKGGNIYIDTNSEKVEQKEYIKIIIRDEG